MLLPNIFLLLFCRFQNWTHQLGRKKNLSFTSCPTCPDAPFQVRPTSSIFFHISAPDFPNWLQSSCSSWWTTQIWWQLASSKFECPPFFFQILWLYALCCSSWLFWEIILLIFPNPRSFIPLFPLTGRIIALYFGCLHAAVSTYLLIRWQASFPGWAVRF